MISLRYNTFPFWHRCSSADFPSSMTDVGPADIFQELQKENNALKERLEPGSPSWVLRVSKLGYEVTCWNMLNMTKRMLSIVGSPNEQIFDLAEYLSNIPPSGKCLTVPGQSGLTSSQSEHVKVMATLASYTDDGQDWGIHPFFLGGTVRLWITTSGCPDWEGEMPQQERCLQGILIFAVRCSLFCLVCSAEMAWHLNNWLYLILCFMCVCISTLVLIIFR